MRLRDSPSSYGPVSRLNHWVGALLLLAMLAIGLYFTDLPPGAERIYWRTLHIAIGTICLPLVAFRVVWRFAASSPQALAQAPALRLLARCVHLLMMVAVLTMLMSGVLMQWFAGRPIGVFDLLRIASPLTESDLWHERMQQVHGIAAWVLIASITVHVVGVIKHILFDRRSLRRMVGKSH